MTNNIKRFTLTLSSVEKMDYYYLFVFNKPSNFKYVEGQFGIFKFIDKVLKNDKPMRAFSIASGVSENQIKIAMKIPEESSEWKKTILKLIPGDKMTFDGPTGHFTLEKEKDGVFIAGGIGIASIRSILMKIRDIGIQKNYDLIYAEQNQLYPFKVDFDKFSFVNCHYTDSMSNTKDKIKQIIAQRNNDACYYVSGSPVFINEIQEYLNMNGIDPENIKYDIFKGYESF